MSTRLATKPGASWTATGVLASFLASSIVVVKVASLVWSARMTSTRAITGTGFMKCMPTEALGAVGECGEGGHGDGGGVAGDDDVVAQETVGFGKDLALDFEFF